MLGFKLYLGFQTELRIKIRRSNSTSTSALMWDHARKVVGLSNDR